MDQRLLLMHQAMIGDRRRVGAYDRALAQAVRPGDVVVDVGAGMLALSMLALKNGAGHVYAIEADPHLVPVARQIAEANRLHGRLTLVQADARSALLPVKADVLVCEMMGNLGSEEEMTEIVASVARRNLKPDAVVIPERLITYLQAVQLDREGWGLWGEDFYGFSLKAVRDYAPGRAHLHFFSRPPIALSAPAPVSNDRLGASPEPARDELTLEVTAAGELHALIGYFNAVLAPGVELSNFPSYPGCNWAVWVWPLRYASVSPGDMLKVRVRRPRNVRLADEWALDCQIAKGATRS